MSRFKRFLLKSLEGVPSLTIDPEKEEELINKLTDTISKYDMELPAMLLLAPFAPLSTVLTQIYLITFVPFLEVLGIKGYEYAALFNKKENVKRLLNKLEDKKRAKSL